MITVLIITAKRLGPQTKRSGQAVLARRHHTDSHESDGRRWSSRPYRFNRTNPSFRVASHRFTLNAQCNLGARQSEDRQDTPRRSRCTFQQAHGAYLSSQRQSLHNVVFAPIQEPILPETAALPQLLGVPMWLASEKCPSLR